MDTRLEALDFDSEWEGGRGRRILHVKVALETVLEERIRVSTMERG